MISLRLGLFAIWFTKTHDTKRLTEFLIVASNSQSPLFTHHL